MNKENVLTVVVALVIGLLGGYLIYGVSSHKEPVVGSSVPTGAGSPTEYQQRIVEAEKIVSRDPNNAQVWNQLANDYFDTNQPQKAVQAYSKVLELDPKNTNALTDQGIMYRKMGWYDKAIANFERAQQIDPNHLQSLYNLGVVYLNDLKKPDLARAAWTKYLQFDSTSPTAQQIKVDLGSLPPPAQK